MGSRCSKVTSSRRRPAQFSVRAQPCPRTGAPKLIKGETYVLKVTHSNPGHNEELNWYADTTNPYQYGRMFVGGDAPLRWDLCARIEGVNRPVSRELAEKPVSQPDLSVDSVWVAQGAGATVTLHARVRNIGNRQFVAATRKGAACSLPLTATRSMRLPSPRCSR